MTADVAGMVVSSSTPKVMHSALVSSYLPQATRGAAVMTAEQAVPCARHLNAGGSVAAAARQAGVNESTLRKALRGGHASENRDPGDGPDDGPAAASAGT
ncbi:MAG: hypothetical protein NTW21_05995 [Verrucomicrobia bacterium]|nr:hypothetical protein [Verrucomicrobiota bacterium]